MIIEVETVSKELEDIEYLNKRLNDLYISKKVIEVCRDLYWKKFINKRKM